MKKAELIQRYWEAKEEEKRFNEEASDSLKKCTSYGSEGKTQVYIPVELIVAEQKEYENFWNNSSETVKKRLPSTLTKERAKENVLDFINKHFHHVRSVAEYTEYRNSITFEVKRFKNRKWR